MSLNIENMNKLADYIEGLPEGVYNQHQAGDFSDDGCGCICHYAGVLSGNLEYSEFGLAINYESTSSDWMGTTYSQWHDLFGLSRWPEKFSWIASPTAKTAAARIRHMIETGE